MTIPSRTPPFQFPWASRFGFRTLDHAVSEMGILETLKENNKSESISYRNRVRIILLWCRWWDSNPHGIATNGF